MKIKNPEIVRRRTIRIFGLYVLCMYHCECPARQRRTDM